MMGRRGFVLGALAGLIGACSKPRTVRSAVHAGVDFVELVPRNPDPALPIVVAIHGRGGAPEHWVDGWMPFPGRAHFALPRGFDRHEEGFAWFPWSTDAKSEKLAADAESAEARLWQGIAALAAGRKVIVAGYDQGAVLSFVMAARHADAIAAAFPVCGMCPEALLPKSGARAARLVAYQGAADDVFPIASTRASVEGFTRAGGDARLREYAGVKHSPTDAMHKDLWADMQGVLAGKE
jgi:predicted esterase